jgi:hypothetical protein
MQTDSSTFYQIAGVKPEEGMFLMEKKEVGINAGFTVERGLSGGMSGGGIKLEFNLSRGGYIPRGVLAYFTVAIDGNENTRQDFPGGQTFSRSNSDVFISYSPSGVNDESFTRLAFGLMYEKYFMRKFHYNVNLGYGIESAGSLTLETIGVDSDDVSLSQGLLDLGGRVGISLTPNLQFETGLLIRSALGSPDFSFSQPSADNPEEDETIRITLEGTNYADIFPGRGFTLSAVFGLRYLF